MEKKRILESIRESILQAGEATPAVVAQVGQLLPEIDEALAATMRESLRTSQVTQAPDSHMRTLAAALIFCTILLRKFFSGRPAVQQFALSGFRSIANDAGVAILGDGRFACALNFAVALRDADSGQRDGYLREAIAVVEQLRDGDGSFPAALAGSMEYSLGLSTRGLESLGKLRPGSSMAHFLRARDSWLKLGQRQRAAEASVHWLEGGLNSPLQRDERFLETAEMELQVLRNQQLSADHSELCVQAAFAIAMSRWRLTGEPSAIRAMRAALEAGGLVHRTHTIAHCWTELGDVLWSEGKKDHAADCYETAERALGSMTDRRDGVESPVSATIYERLVRHAVENRQLSRAWNCIEKSKCASRAEQFVPLEQIQQFARARRTGILQFFLGTDFFVVLKISPTAPPEMTRGDERQLGELFSAIRAYLQAYELNLLEWQEGLPSLLRQIELALQLNDRVPDPEEKAERLIIVPHRITRLIPFGALRVRGEYLQDYCAQGVQTVRNCGPIMQRTGLGARSRFDRAFLILNPTEDLPGAIHEGEIIKATYRVTSGLSGSDASLANLLGARAEIEAADCLHFSCHGSFVTESKLSTRLQLASESSLDLQLLRERSFNLSKCSLVFLAACETGVFDANTSGDEMNGLSMAFLDLGAGSVVCTLWEADDLAVAIFVTHFYPELRALALRGERNWLECVGRAINHAQNRLRATTAAECMMFIRAMKVSESQKAVYVDRLRILVQGAMFDHPFYWAPFTSVSRCTA